MTPETQKILVVDDDPRNVRLLEGIFRSAGYIVDKAHSGKEALERISEAAPDLVLLDVMMPGMSGHEVCRAIKEDARTQMIPIMLVTALSALEDKVEGLDLGADDFVSKPVNRVELLAKTRSLLRIKTLHDQLACANSQLADKNQELRKLERTKETLVQMIVHDLKNPLTAIMGNLGLIVSLPDGPPERTQQRAGAALESCRAMMRLTLDLLDIGRLEENQMSLDRKRVPLGPIVDAALAEAGGLVAQSGIVLRSEMGSAFPPADADPDLVARILANLLSNALKHTPDGGAVTVGGEARGEEVIVFVRDTGEGIPAEYQQAIFEKYAQAEVRRLGLKSDRGLGLTFCKMAAEAHGGRIWVESAAGEGSTFFVALPVFKESAEPSGSQELASLGARGTSLG